MQARISMSELNDRSMIAHVRDECAWRVIFFSDIIYSGYYLESLALFLWRVLAVRNRRCPWKLEL